MPCIRLEWDDWSCFVELSAVFHFLSCSYWGERNLKAWGHNLDRCGRSVSKLVQSVAPKFTSLECCTIKRCDLLNDQAIEAIGSNWHSLRALDLTKGARLTDSSLLSLANGCPQLEMLDLSGCIGFSESGLVILAQHCKNLQYLNLCGCNNAGSDIALQVRWSIGRWLILWFQIRLCSFFAYVTVSRIHTFCENGYNRLHDLFVEMYLSGLGTKLQSAAALKRRVVRAHHRCRRNSSGCWMPRLACCRLLWLPSYHRFCPNIQNHFKFWNRICRLMFSVVDYCHERQCQTI